jgi:hypothetical protein
VNWAQDMTNQPTHDVFHVRDVAEGKSRWTTIGVAWAHRDGKGFTIKLDGLVPLDGKLHLRERREPSQEAEPPSDDLVP